MQIAFESDAYMSQEAFAEWALARHGSDINHYELLNGRIVMTPPAGYPHGGVEANLVTALHAHLQPRRLGRVFGSSQGFELPSGDTLEPDVSYVSNERWQAAPAPEMGRFLRVVPDLVVEILSPTTASRDRGEKKGIYERNGVLEYWLVDPRARLVRRFVLVDGRFDLGTVFEEDAVLESVVLDGFRAPVADLLAS